MIRWLTQELWINKVQDCPTVGRTRAFCATPEMGSPPMKNLSCDSVHGTDVNECLDELHPNMKEMKKKCSKSEGL